MKNLGHVRLSKGKLNPAGVRNRKKQAPNLFSIILDPAFNHKVHLIQRMITLIQVKLKESVGQITINKYKVTAHKIIQNFKSNIIT